MSVAIEGFIAYGAHPDQQVEYAIPTAAAPRPVVVLLHGGYWRDRYGCGLMQGLADDVVTRGWAAWNVEYRRLGSGGGWPQTLDDVRGAIAAIRWVQELDPTRVALVGHSAGGHLALLAGAADVDPRPCAVVAQAPVSDLVDAQRRGLSDGAAALLLGGTPEAEADRYRAASPIGHLPGIPTLVVHGAADEDVPVEQSRAYAAAAERAGAPVRYVELPGGHMEHIDPTSTEWRLAADWLAEHLGPAR